MFRDKFISVLSNRKYLCLQPANDCFHAVMETSCSQFLLEATEFALNTRIPYFSYNYSDWLQLAGGVMPRTAGLRRVGILVF